MPVFFIPEYYYKALYQVLKAQTTFQCP